MILYALLPPFPAYVLNDFVVRGIAAAGAFLMLGRLEVPRVPQHLLSVLFAISLANTTYGLSIAGLSLAIWLLDRRERWRLAGLLLIGWNSSLYLSGLFFLPASGFFHALVLREPLDRNFWRGLAAYFAGLVLGNVGLMWLFLTSHEVSQRTEWGAFPPRWLFTGKSVAEPLFPLFLLAMALGWSSRRVRWLAIFGAFTIAWYAVNQLPWMQLHRPWDIQIDRFYFLWPVALILICGLPLEAPHPGQGSL
jgi:hypothetical protein